MMRRLLAAAVAVVLIGGGTFGYLVLHNPKPGKAVEVVVAPGSTTAGIGSELHHAGVIGNTLVFRVLAKLRGLDGKIEAGRYAMFEHMGTEAALSILAKGAIEKGVPVTVPPGFTAQEIGERVGARSKISVAAFAAAASKVTLPAVLGGGVKPAEGTLFPDTYFVGEQENATELVGRMEGEFQKQTAALDWARATALGVSRYDIVIIASLIEREAKVPEDRAKVAAVIYNRLHKKMRLQIDATAIYGIPHKVPTLADLSRPSPYNTYLIDGLPPTPIASPGLAALDAALHPAPIDALYYVVCEPSGQSCFTNSAAEFERLKARRPPGTH